MHHLQPAMELSDTLPALDTFGPMGIGTGVIETMFGFKAVGAVHPMPEPFGFLEIGTPQAEATRFGAGIGGVKF